MTISNSFLVRIVADTELGRTAAATSPGAFSAAMSVPSLATPIARLDPFNPDGTDYPDCSGGTTTNGYSMTRAWIWASKAMFDTTTRRVLFVNSPHPFDAFGQPTFPNGNYNGYITLLTAYDEADNDIHVYESPFSYNNATWPRTVGHAFDNQCLVDRTLYKMTTPLWPNATEGWVQPQLAKIDIDQVTDSVASAREGEAYLGSLNAPWEWDESALTWRNPGRNLTAGALDYLPGSDSLVFFHKKWLSFCPISTGTWTQPIDLQAQGYGFSGTYVAELGRITWPNHNVGHYNAASGKFVCGGGAYNPDGASNHRYQLDWISVDATTQAITKLDDSPVIMSVSETDMPTTEPAAYQVAKVAACAGPNSVESLFFHDNGNVYGLNPFRPPGYQWRVVTTLAFEVDLCVPIDDYGVVLLFTSGANGTASMRVYKPPVAGDHTPPSIPLDVAATATSSSEITVTWSASTDPVIQGDTTSGLSGYKVYRGGTLVATLGNVLTYSDTGLSASTAYSYTVSAYDVAGNESEVSVADSATTEQAAGSYVATHFVAPYASVTDVNGNPAANDYANLEVTAPGSWARALNSNTPTTLGTAMANAVAGNKVRCEPGVYTGLDYGDRWIGSFQNANSGTAGNPIIFYARYPAATNYGQSSLYTELRRTVTNYTTDASPALQFLEGSQYVVYDGFYANENHVIPGAVSGIFGMHVTTGCEYRRIAVDRRTFQYPQGGNYGIFFLQTTTDGRVTDCYLAGDVGYNNWNDANFEIYGCEGLIIEHCTWDSPRYALYLKARTYGPNNEQTPTVRYCKFLNCLNGPVHKDHGLMPFHNNLIIARETGLYENTNDLTSLALTNAYNNTIVMYGTSAPTSGPGGIRIANATYDGSTYRDNIVYLRAGAHANIPLVSRAASAYTSTSEFTMDYNHYYDANGTPTWTNEGSTQPSLTLWREATGKDMNSTEGNPLFVNEGTGDYRLQAGSPASAGVGGRTTTAGCYITGTEEIGVRANPSY